MGRRLLLGVGGSGGGGPTYSPSLDFSDYRNSQYLYELLEEWLM